MLEFAREAGQARPYSLAPEERSVEEEMSTSTGRNFAIICIGVLALVATASASMLSDVVGVYDVGDASITKHNVGAQVLITNACDYDWWYGCSPTSAGMMMGHYDREGRTNMVPGGVAELETYVGPPTGWAALANNAIASQGHVADFYVGGYGASGDDVAPPHHSFDSVADFMGTSQDSCGNSNGSTTFYYWTNGAPFTEADAVVNAVQNTSGMYGIGEYVDYSGYADPQRVLYNQYIDAYGQTFGFTLAQYKAEIDANRPVLIHIAGHTMCGVGYDDELTTTIYVFDTWSAGPHSMTWGGLYSGEPHYAVTVLTIPEPATLMLLSLSGVVLLRRRKR